MSDPDFLRDFAATIARDEPEIAKELSRIADIHETLLNNRTFEEGYATAVSDLRGRSNLEAQPVEDHKIKLFDEIERLAREGRIRKIPTGVSGLEEAPTFNQRPAAKPKRTLDIELDLSGL